MKCALVQSYRETIFFAVIIIIHQIINFCISYHHVKYHQGGVSAKEWTAGAFAVSNMDAVTSKISPILPRTMLKMAIGSTTVLVVFLGIFDTISR